ncbi:sulfonate ABC transporter substrate-binding protein [Paenibacillus sp. 1P03SA]|uniref:sulfonate ABC transporter substrate-binding protein n=1 Tax=Paenibacillus sp. 1P03SA TaxID=3132294 RepID=UPI0039A389F5
MTTITRRLTRSARTKVRLAVFMLAAAAVLSACSSGKAVETGAAAPKEAKSAVSGETKVLRIGYQKGNTLNILKEHGNLEKRLKEKNITVEWKVFAGGNFLLEALTAESIDFGHAADGSGVFAQAGGKPFVYVGCDLPNPEGMGIVVHAGSPVKTAADLKGKKIAVAKGGNHHYLAVLAIEKAGLKLEDVKFVFVKDASEGRALFETKQVDALGSWDPFFASVENDLSPVTLTDGTGFSPNRTFYYANETFAKSNAGLIKTILEEIDVSDKWANTNKPEVVKQLTEALGIDRKAIERAVNRRTYGVENLTPEIIGPQQKLADTFQRIGLIGERIDVAPLMPVQEAWAIGK